MKKEVLQIRLPTELKEKLRAISEQRGVSINSIIVQALWNMTEG